jgi:tetratricopeptide (TPR) repeat protein
VALLLAGGLAWAGATDSRVTSAYLALESGDPEMAMKKAEEALADPGALKPKNVPRAWHLLAEARLRAAKEGDALLRLGAVEAAGHCVEDARWGPDCRRVQDEAGISLLNHHIARPEPTPGQPDAARVAEALSAAWPHTWIGPLLLGAIAMDANGRQAAARHYTVAAERMGAGAHPKQPQAARLLTALRIANTVQIAGLDVARAEQGAFEAALRATYPDGTEHIDAAAAVARESIDEAAAALARLEADASAPDAPTDKRVAWATLLDQMNQFDRATAAWRAAAESDPGHFEAWYFWGVHHYNRAAGLMDADPDAARRQLEAARGPFEHAAGLKPDDAQLRNALVNICAVTGDLPCMQRYETRAP